MLKLSVTIPYYRGSAVIKDAVRSVLDQTRSADEIVICDDGSPDDLDGALAELRGYVTVVRKANGGIASAMNAAAAAASGDFVVQLDQDDVFTPVHLERIAGLIERRQDLDVVATDASIEYDGTEVAKLGAVQPFRDEQQRTGILERCFFMWPAIRRSSLTAVGGYDEDFAVMQDWECFIRLVLAGAHVGYTGDASYCWRLTPGSRSAADGVVNAEALVQMMTKTLGSPYLSVEERMVAERALAAHERRLLSERAHHAVQIGAGDARRLAWELARATDASPITRAKAAVAGCSPGVARRLMRRRAVRSPAAEALARRGFQRL